MINSISVFDKFDAVPYLATSDLMRKHGGEIKFSDQKPNVIVGPNGSGKSALLKALSLLTLTHYLPESTLNSEYTQNSVDGEKYWSRENPWSRDYRFLAGLVAIEDKAPAFYYRPNHIPGNESCPTHAMMS
jgi:energy-coupling factor transporter ATP-binding protein EcfA2